MVDHDAARKHAIDFFERTQSREEELDAEHSGEWDEGWCFRCRIANVPTPGNVIYGVWPVFVSRRDGQVIELSPEEGVDEVRSHLRNQISDETV